MDRYQSTFKSKDSKQEKISLPEKEKNEMKHELKRNVSSIKEDNVESQILLLNEILKRQIELEKKIDSLSTSKLTEKSKKIVVQRDAEGKIIGAEIVE